MKRINAIGNPILVMLVITLFLGLPNYGAGTVFAGRTSIPETLDKAHRVEFRTEAHAPHRWPKDPEKIYGYLYKPDGNGPFPAVVFLHGCAGFRPVFKTKVRHWAARLVEWGYVVFLADSLEARGVKTLCGHYNLVSPGNGRPRDAYGALKHLQNLQFVDPDRIGVMGWSHGGWTVLFAMEKTPAFRSSVKARFRAAIALYPYCGSHRGGINSHAPLLVLIGEKDDWTPAYMCESMVAIEAEGGNPIQLKVYPGAYHGFDSRRITPLDYLGHHMEHNPAAEQDAVKRVKAFLAENLKEK